MKPIDRRTALKLAAGAPLAITWSWTACGTAARNAQRAIASGEPFTPQFFDDHQYQTVRVLTDIIIPADDRSGSATDAGVPEFMDFMMIDRPNDQAWMSDWLTWLDTRSSESFAVTFVNCTEEQRGQVLDAVAWPDRADAADSDGVAFFNRFRDLTASGFWTSRMGIEDLRYIGNTVNPNWNGCPPEALARLGVSYED
ncbi:MAG TPA: gluconate 2-dehydrogenase subunit 3 family protein [Longimicrobiales bacterium]|nr:gluconate 2-dehydrogenase subunit 3 family protein [Longimicrobiales bacterium]